MTNVKIDVRMDQGAVFGIIRDPEVQNNIDELADAALTMQRALCPVDTGRMLRSLGIRKTPNGTGREVGSFGLNYPAYVESGHRTRGGTWVPPQPFIRPSIDAVMRRLRNG